MGKKTQTIFSLSPKKRKRMEKKKKNRKETELRWNARMKMRTCRKVWGGPHLPRGLRFCSVLTGFVTSTFHHDGRV